MLSRLDMARVPGGEGEVGGEMEEVEMEVGEVEVV